MTKDQVDVILSWGTTGMALGAGVGVCVVALIQFFKLQMQRINNEHELAKTRIIEGSVGSTKVNEMMVMIGELKAMYSRLEEKYKDYEKKLDSLHEDYRDMIERILKAKF
jgi:hypothetical protein